MLSNQWRWRNMCGGYTGEYDAGIEDNFNKHGGPFDRGSADSYYGRSKDPHYYPNGTYNEPRIVEFDMTQDEIDAYHKGFHESEADGNFKDYA